MTKNKTLFALSIITTILLGSAALVPQAFAGVTTHTITVDAITSPTTDTQPTFTGTISPVPTTTGELLVKVTSSIDGIVVSSDVCGTDGLCTVLGLSPGDWSQTPLNPISLGTHTLTFELFGDTATPVVRELVIETTLSTEEQIEEIIEDVESLDVNNGNQKSLTKKLDGAIKNITNEDPTDDAEACEKLQSFINQLNAFVNSGKLVQADIELLVDSANSLIDDLC